MDACKIPEGHDVAARLCQAIMNIPCDPYAGLSDACWHDGCRTGHRDARHAAVVVATQILSEYSAQAEAALELATSHANELVAMHQELVAAKSEVAAWRKRCPGAGFDGTEVVLSG
jgi:hypothetical protein